MKIASIDIGTNSILLTIAEKKNNEVLPLIEKAEITRLGEGVKKNNRLKSGAIERSLTTIKNYKEIVQSYEIKEILVAGTETLRRAKNADEFTEAASKILECDINIISGQEEARLSYIASKYDFGADIVVIDVGGGSTEFITKQGEKISFVSLAMGSVVLHEQYIHSDPVSSKDYNQLVNKIGTIFDENKKVLKTMQQTKNQKRLIAIAGTATTLAAIKKQLKNYNHSKIHGHEMSINDINRVIRELKRKNIEERKRIPGLDSKRADIIFAGGLIIEQAMKNLSFDKLTVSDRGVRWGLIYNYFYM